MLSQDQIDTFHATGFLKIPGLIGGDELRQLQAAAQAVEAEGLAHAGDDHLYRRQPDGSRSYFRSERMWSRAAIFRATTVHPGLLTALAQVIGHPYLPWNDSLVSKQAQSQVPIEFHQDPPYWKPEVDQTFGVPDLVTDIYLQPATIANGCVHGIPGKHLLGTLDLAAHSEDELFTDCGAIPFEMAPGDVLFHALSAPHGSRANPTNATRTTFYLKYKALEVEDWKAKGSRAITYDQAGIEQVRSFMAERAALGFDDALPDGLSLEADGFVWHGSPATPPWHWRTLAQALPADQAATARQLRVR